MAPRSNVALAACPGLGLGLGLGLVRSCLVGVMVRFGRLPAAGLAHPRHEPQVRLVVGVVVCSGKCSGNCSGQCSGKRSSERGSSLSGSRCASAPVRLLSPARGEAEEKSSRGPRSTTWCRHGACGCSLDTCGCSLDTCGCSLGTCGCSLNTCGCSLEGAPSARGPTSHRRRRCRRTCAARRGGTCGGSSSRGARCRAPRRCPRA